MSATPNPMIDWMSPSGTGSWNVPMTRALVCTLPCMATGPMGETSSRSAVTCGASMRRLL